MMILRFAIGLAALLVLQRVLFTPRLTHESARRIRRTTLR